MACTGLIVLLLFFFFTCRQDMTLMEGTAGRPGLMDAVDVLRRLPLAFCVADKINVLHAVLLRIQQAIVRDTSRGVSFGSLVISSSGRGW